MLLLVLILLPAAAGGIAYLLPQDALRRIVWLAGAVVHTGLTLAVTLHPPAGLGDYLGLDSLGLLFLWLVSVLFLASSVYGVAYMAAEPKDTQEDREEPGLFTNTPERVFTACLLLFLATMTWVTLTRHFALLWVAIEATTLASAPLIYFHRHHRSLEATWKYLLVCSVGIALALLGNFLLALAATTAGGEVPLTVEAFLHRAAQTGAKEGLNLTWLKAAFIFLFVGYATKMGLAPLHTWLPDAHSEAPSVVSALLSGALLNCAFLGILRVQQVMQAAGLGEFGRDIFVLFGLISMALAAVFILGQADFKRMLAYSSIENMGILALGVGLGGAGVFGAMLHAVNHSLTKGVLFLVAGNIVAAYRTKSAGEVRGLLQAMPMSGILWLVGFLAITGSPPFGPFLSEFTILRAAFEQGRWGVGVGYLALLCLVFVGMAGVVLGMAQGRPQLLKDGKLPSVGQERFFRLFSPALLASAVLMLGVYIPPAVRDLLQSAAQLVGGT